MSKFIIEELKQYTENEELINLAEKLSKDKELDLLMNYERIYNSAHLPREIIELLMIGYINMCLIKNNQTLAHIIKNPVFIKDLENFTKENMQHFLELCENEVTAPILENKDIIGYYSVESYLRIADLVLETRIRPGAPTIIAYIVQLAMEECPIEHFRTAIDLVPTDPEEIKKYLAFATNEVFKKDSTPSEQASVLEYYNSLDEEEKKLCYNLFTFPNFNSKCTILDKLSLIREGNHERLSTLFKKHQIFLEVYNCHELIAIVNEFWESPILLLLSNEYLQKFLSLKEILYLYRGLDLDSIEDVQAFINLIQKYQSLLPEENGYSSILALLDYESYTKALKKYMKNYEPKNPMRALETANYKLL